MILTLDGEKLEHTFRADDVLQNVVDSVRQQHLGERLVVSLAVNGETLLDSRLTERLERPVGVVEQVDLTSADRGTLAAEALRETARQLELAAGAHREIADALDTGQAVGAVRDYADVLGVWHALRSSIENSGRILSVDLMECAVEGRPVRQRLSELAARLREVRDAFESRDWVLLSDLMRYEMPETCGVWTQVCAALAEQVETAK